MDTILDLLSGLPAGGIIALLALLGLQLTLQVYSVIDLVRRDRVPPGKWFWALVIVLGNLLGAVIYLVVGRRSGDKAEFDLRSSEPGSHDRALDLLYGDERTGPS